MKPADLLPFAFVILSIACNQAEPAQQGDDAVANDERYDALAQRVSSITGTPVPAKPQIDAPVQGSAPVALPQGGIRTHIIQSTDQNMPLAQINMPAHWQYQQDKRTGNWGATGKGLEVKNHGYQSFLYTTGDMAHYYQNAGGKLRQAVGPEQVLRQDLEPLFRKDGLEFLGMADAPAIAKADQQSMDGLISFGQVRKTSRALASDWKKGDRRYLVVLHWNAMESPEMENWGYHITVLETDASAYDREKAGLLNSLASLQYNPAYFAAYNQKEQQKAQQSWSSHNARMQNNQAAFDAQQRTFRENSNATNDAIMGTYRSNSAASDRNQDAFINTIREERNAVDPHTGGAIKIESGSNNYWMNQNGQYYGTDDVMHDPNIGNTTNDQWRQIEVEP